MLNESEVILKSRNIVKQFKTNEGNVFTACNNINLDVYKGKTLGLVGESGCGKSTFVRMLVQIEAPTSGEILYRDKNILKFSKKELWENRQNIQMVFQDPAASFNPRMKIIDILTEPLINYGRLKKKDKETKAKQLLKLVELNEEFLYRYPHSISGGQRQRIGIARALSLEPEILVCDEVTSALDVSIQKNIIDLLIKLQNKKNMSIIFICHDMALVQSFADEVAVMYRGNIVEVLPGDKVSTKATHPYTQLLLSSLFSVDMDYNKKIEATNNDEIGLAEIEKGCVFQNRCKHCKGKCKDVKPELIDMNLNHKIACHLTDNG